MIGRFLGWIAQRGMLAVTVIAGLAAINVLVQTYMHKTTALTAWKGGGFGMYTEPHPDQRTVLLEIGGGAAQLVLWPEGGNVSDWAGSLQPQGRKAVLSLQDQAARFRYYPRDRLAAALIDRAARFRWDNSLLNGLTPEQGKTFDASRLTLRVTDQRHQPFGTVMRDSAYCYGAEC